MNVLKKTEINSAEAIHVPEALSARLNLDLLGANKDYCISKLRAGNNFEKRPKSARPGSSYLVIFFYTVSPFIIHCNQFLASHWLRTVSFILYSATYRLVRFLLLTAYRSTNSG